MHVVFARAAVTENESFIIQAGELWSIRRNSEPFNGQLEDCIGNAEAETSTV